MKLLICSVFTVMVLISCTNRHEYQQLNTAVDDQKSLIADFERQLLIFTNNEHDTINLNSVGLNFEREYIKLKELVDSQSRLFMFISQKSCLSCFREQLSVVKDFKELANNKLVIISSFPDIRTLYIFFNENKINYQIVNFKSDDLGIKRDLVDQIAFFVINQDGIISMLFIPIREKPEYTKYYLNIIEKRFLKNGGLS